MPDLGIEPRLASNYANRVGNFHDLIFMSVPGVGSMSVSFLSTDRAIALGRIWNSIGPIPDHCFTIYFRIIKEGYCLNACLSVDFMSRWKRTHIQYEENQRRVVL